MRSSVSERSRGDAVRATHRFGVGVGHCLACALLGAAVAFTASTGAAQELCGNPDRDACTNDPPIAAETARGIALGTGMRAASVSTSALAYSPGALALGNLYHIEANVDYMTAFETVALGAAAVDSSTSKIGAGIGLRGFLSGDDGYATDYGYDLNGLDGRLGVAFALSDAFSIGVLGRYINVSTETEDNDDVELVEGFTMDASLRIVPTDGLQIDIGALNFIDLDKPYVPVMITGGIAIAAVESLSFGVDVLTDVSSFDNPQVTVGGGIEYLGGNSVPIRAGYSFDVARELHALGVGIGYTDQRIGLDLGVQQQLNKSGEDPRVGHETRILAAVRYYVH